MIKQTGFPFDEIRACRGCDLRDKCTSPVPGTGVFPAPVFFLGRNPGWEEDKLGEPFVGKAGQQLNSLLLQCGLNREQIYISNVVKCWTVNDVPPKAAQISACSRWLGIELSLAQPEIVVAMGAEAIRQMLGGGIDTVEHLHGRPVEVDGRIVLPCYHPAAGLHDTSNLRFLYDDFQVLRGLLRGRTVADYTVRDEYPNPDYRVADDPVSRGKMQRAVEGSGEMAVDTEQKADALWSVQISAAPGTGWFIPIRPDYCGKFKLRDYAASVVVHNYLHDVRFLDIPDDRFLDSMTLAYLLGLPQGLKELASRLCGMKMRSYGEIVRPGQRKLSLDYLSEAERREWPDPPDVEVTGWSNKAGCVVTRIKHPWHISRKVSKLVADAAENSDLDILDRWRKIPEVERDCVERVLGPMPESSLADISMEDAVQYAVRDSDATLRVKRKMEKLIQDSDLGFVLHMDTAILPMVRAMMDTGMAVDLDHLRKLSADYDSRMRRKASDLASTVGRAFNPSSSPQVALVVYDELGFRPTQRTPSGEISTDDQELKKTGHPVAKGIIEYRRLSKMKGTYADALVRWAIPDAEGTPRVHTTLKTTRTETGRLSSAEPLNLQTIPTRNKEARAIKSAFVAPGGKVLVEADYAQVEMCTQAHLANCRNLIDLFLAGKDPHTATASIIFGVSYEEAKKTKYRYPTKRANFGVIYMIGARGLSAQIAEYIADLEMDGEPVDIEPWSVETCQKYIDDWYRLNPEVQDYQMEMAAQARRYGWVSDMFGRRRFIPEVSCAIKSVQDAGLRMAANMPVSASAQGIIKLAMGQLWRGLSKTGWQNRVKWLMQIHDSLLTEVDDDPDFVREYLSWTLKIMCGVVQLVVPVKVDFKVGKQWGSLQKLA